MLQSFIKTTVEKSVTLLQGLTQSIENENKTLSNHTETTTVTSSTNQSPIWIVLGSFFLTVSAGAGLWWLYNRLMNKKSISQEKEELKKEIKSISVETDKVEDKIREEQEKITLLTPQLLEQRERFNDFKISYDKSNKEQKKNLSVAVQLNKTSSSTAKLQVHMNKSSSTSLLDNKQTRLNISNDKSQCTTISNNNMKTLNQQINQLKDRVTLEEKECHSMAEYLTDLRTAFVQLSEDQQALEKELDKVEMNKLSHRLSI